MSLAPYLDAIQNQGTWKTGLLGSIQNFENRSSRTQLETGEKIKYGAVLILEIDRNCDVLPLLFDYLLKYNINVSFTLKNKIKSQTAQIEFHKFSEKMASGVEVV